MSLSRSQYEDGWAESQTNITEISSNVASVRSWETSNDELGVSEGMLVDFTEIATDRRYRLLHLNFMLDII
jgi:hypothetical protein